MSVGSPGWSRRLRERALGALYATGPLRVLLRTRLRRRLAVLTYHRVLPQERLARSCSSRAIIVTPETFERQIRFIRHHLQPLSADGFLRALHGGTPPPRACLVTFDDGWYDLLEFALPIMRRHGVPAVLFVPVDHVGSPCGFWQERLARRLLALTGDPRALATLAQACPSPAPLQADLSDVDAVLALIARLKSLPSAVRDRLVASIEGLGADPGPGEDRFLDWDQLRTVAASGLVSIGSHAMSHRPLTQLPPDEVRRELVDSRHAIEERLGAPPALLAYPNGDATPAIAAAAAEAGYAAAFTTERGLIPPGASPHLLRRVNMHEAATRTYGAFVARLLGLA